LAAAIQSLRQVGVNTLVSLLPPLEATQLHLEAEAAHCQAHGINFVAFPIPDFGIPASITAAKRLVQQVATALNDNQQVVIHCHGGRGRSSLLAAAVLTQYGLSPQTAFTTIGQARGCDVPETEAQFAWVVAFAEN
jgi:protein-tyrosine phosphatase